jgi:hypothetical protein
VSASGGPHFGEFDPKNAHRKPLVILKTVLNARFGLYTGENRTVAENQRRK